MKLLASLALLLLAPVQEPPAGDGPRGTSQVAAGEVRYDVVGYAARADTVGVAAVSSALPPGSYAEVTALDSGRTIVVAVTGGMVAPGRVAMLSGAAATALGMTADELAVRIRKVAPTPQDIAALRGGDAASFRAEAPPALLTALRKKLPQPVASRASGSISPQPAAKSMPVAKRLPRTIPPSKPVAAPASVSMPATTAPLRSGYVVQVAALSSASRAATLARTIGGTVIPGPPVWRVRLGPYADPTAAARTKADLARRGYLGAQISRFP